MPRIPAAAADELYVAHNRLLIVDTGRRRPVAEIPIDEVVNGIAFSRDGAFLGTSGGKDLAASSGGLYLADAAARRVLRKLSSDPVKEVRVSPDGKGLHVLEWRVRVEEKTGGRKKPVAEPFRLQSYDITGPEPKPVRSVGVGVDLYDLAVSPDGRTAYLLDPGHNGLRVLDLEQGTFVQVLELEGGRKADGTHFEAALSKMAVSPDGARAAVLQSGSSRTGALVVDLDKRTRRQVLFPAGSNLRAGRYTPDGKSILALSLERLLVLDPEAGTVVRTVALRETFTSMAVSSDGSEVYLGAPVALRTKEARGGGLVTVLDGRTLARLEDVPIPITVKFLALAPRLVPPEK
jgi:DNA-binding beta-propeller fold protein YncE